MHTELCLGWKFGACTSRGTAARTGECEWVPDIFTWDLELLSFRQSLFFFVCLTCLASQADYVTSLLSPPTYWTIMNGACVTRIDHTISWNTHTRTHTQSVTMATPILDAHTHRHRRQMGQWTKMYMLFDLLPIEAIMLVSCRGTARHERVWTVN